MAVIIHPPHSEGPVNKGEDRLLKFLKDELPDSYILIPNIEIASTNPRNNRTQFWEYDVVLVAPHAVYNIENKDWKGRIEGDDNYWYHNDRERPNPHKTLRKKTSILASKLKEQEYRWGKAWIQSTVTLSYPNSVRPSLWEESGKLTFELNGQLIDFLTDPGRVGKRRDDISDLKQGIVDYLTGVQSQRKPEEKREVQGYEILEVLEQDINFVEYLVKPKGVTSSIRKRIREYSLQVNGLSPIELERREEAIKNQYTALHKIKAHPFILNVAFKIDEENHLFYEISDYLDGNSLRAEAYHQTFTFSEKLRIVRNLIDALKEAHKENIFHRDINPDNVFLSGGYARLGNFGKSYFSDHQAKGYTVMATLTESNTTAYHPLELTVGEASRRSDIYSLGVLVYWLFTGEEPVKTPYALNKMGGRLSADRLPTAINPALPKWLDELCGHTILTDDEARWGTLDEFEAFIETAMEEGSSSAAAAPTAEQGVIDSYDLEEGDRIGNDYIIHKILGTGGYSRVFKVKHNIQGNYFALKLFNESVSLNSAWDEYNALKRLAHPNIVKFIWNGSSNNGQFYTVMEFLEGESLNTYTRTDAKLPVSTVYKVGVDILSALVEMQAMEQPIFHRDIKPQNIVWDKKERFVLIDFNVASFAEDNKDFVGTNPYLAPDLINNHQVAWDSSADTFALGITLYELVCKQYPWKNRFPLIGKPPVSPQDHQPLLSQPFAEFLLKAIATDKSERFTTAQKMLDALRAIGPENVLAEKVANGRSADPLLAAEHPGYVDYLNSLYSQSRHGNAGTRASVYSSVYDDLTYTETKLDKKLVPAILDGKFKLVIITGNAGDGKTAFIQRIERDDQVRSLERFGNKNGARFSIGGTAYESNYDGSQDEEERLNDQVLEDFFAPFAGLDKYSEASEGRIIAINEGRLVEFLQTSGGHQDLAQVIEDYFYEEGHHELPEGLMIINLNLRSVVASDADTPSLFRQQMRALTQKSLWKKCEGCALADRCFIKYNVDSFNDEASGESVTTRMEWVLKAASLKRELHVTMRDLRSFIAFTLTRDYRCNEVESLIETHHLDPEKYWQYYYFNITAPRLKDGGEQDRLIHLLRETDIGEVSIPDLDRDLYFGHHQAKDFLPFSDRDTDLLAKFNAQKILVPAHDQSVEVLQQIKELQKVFIRHQYFEGASRSILEESDEEGEGSQMPFYLDRLPYHSVFQFLEVLKNGDKTGKTKYGISRAISLNEGCDNEGIDRDFLVLASTEVKDPFAKSFRLFPLEDFELFVNETRHLVTYLEYEPDSLVFRHKAEPHIRLTISLDLYEMLYFIQQGFSPSLNDLRGKFIELLIFKNLLENLKYDRVLLTEDNNAFFQVVRTAENHLVFKPFEIN